jgi:hypothetical protein
MEGAFLRPFFVAHGLFRFANGDVHGLPDE